MAQQIPKRLLIHSVTHKTGETIDTWQNITYTNTTTINRVRIEPSTKRVISIDNNEIQLNALMFYDCVNSNPSGIDFLTGEAITFGTANYKIVYVELLYDESKLHHYELGLV